eukprot:TRINITY_DN2500_c0_g1_i14.p1 TRINITY_DN2500_c0_g1~~TRINITY_DN2500_c0_g1_i14.p1  ORF type:complete len:121 (+),score=27.78 TRINITY_DN2500_c0_g1_i14:93-455(+)
MMMHDDLVKEIDLLRRHVLDKTRLMQFDELKRQIESNLRVHHQTEMSTLSAKAAAEKAMLERTVAQLRQQVAGIKPPSNQGSPARVGRSYTQSQVRTQSHSGSPANRVQMQNSSYLNYMG